MLGLPTSKLLGPILPSRRGSPND